ncbi:MAG TPA: DivIVA domain-containing protein, partial [Solirubrobacteraceae bacterium]|nr:DivIVA domain-containing protein [Solirubrobacteraceae bacterium]
MPLTPDEIVNFPLRQGVRGYSVRQGDELLDNVADTIERLHRELAETRARLARAEGRVEEMSDTESTLKRTLITAQRAAEQAIAEARERAREIVEEATAGAAQESAAQREEEERLNARVEELREFEREYRAGLRAFLDEQVRALDDLEVAPDDDPQDEDDAAPSQMSDARDLGNYGALYGAGDAPAAA